MDTKEKVSIYKAKGKWLTALILFTGTTSIGTISNGTVIGLASEINSASTITKTTDKPASASTSTTETVSSNSENISANKITAPNSTETITASSATSASTYTAQNVTSDSEGISANKITAPNSTETGSDTSSVTGPFLTDKNTYGTIAISSNLAPTVTDETNKLVNSYKQVGNKVYFLGSDGQPITGLRHYGNNKLEYYGSDHVQYRNRTVYIDNISYYFGGNGDGQASNISRQAAVIKLAKTKLGAPYTQSQAGRLGPNSFDCSGFVYYLYKTAAGITLNGTVTTTEEKSGKEVSLNELQPGDLLFYGSRGNTYHVGLYEGNGMMIHAATPEEGVKETAIKYYQPSFARRVLI